MIGVASKEVRGEEKRVEGEGKFGEEERSASREQANCGGDEDELQELPHIRSLSSSRRRPCPQPPEATATLGRISCLLSGPPRIW